MYRFSNFLKLRKTSFLDAGHHSNRSCVIQTDDIGIRLGSQDTLGEGLNSMKPDEPVINTTVLANFFTLTLFSTPSY